MKKKLLFIAIIAASAIMLSSHQGEEKIDILLENIEAYADSDEHGEIDETLVPYSKLGSKTIYFLWYGQIISTKVPCCMSDTSKFSGCAKGLDNC